MSTNQKRQVENMAADGTVEIDLELNQDKAEKELSSLSKKGFGALEKAAKAATTAVAAGATAIGGYALKVGTSFESTMSEVQAISGATGDQMQLLSDKAKEMGSTTSFSATEAGEAMTYMAMAGWKTEDMLDGIGGIMNLAAASGEDLATTSDIVTDALTAFGMSASESGKFADVLAAASSNANTNVSMLGESFKYVAPVAGSLGYSAEDTSIALGLMANSGIKASQAGTALRAALTRMVKPTDKAAALMDKYGISLTNSDGSMKTMKEVMDNLRGSMGGLSEAQQAQVAATIFGQEAMSGMLAIVNASEADYGKLTEAIYNSEGAAEKMANIRLDNLSGQLTLLKSAAEGFGLVVYESMAAPLTNLATQGQQAISTLTGVLQNQGAAAMFTAGAGMLTNLINGIAVQAPALSAKAGDMISGFLYTVSATAPQLMTAGVNAIASFITGIGAQLPELVPQALKMVVTLADAVIDNIPTIVDAGINLLAGLVKGIINSLPTLIKEGPRIVNKFSDAIYSGVGKLLSTGAKLIVQLGKGIISNMPLIIQNGGQILMALINAFSLSKMLSLGKNLITFVKNGLSNMGPKLVSAGKTVAQNTISAFKAVDWGNAGSSVLKMLVNGLKAVAGLLKDALKIAAKNALNAVKNIDVKSVGVNIIKGIASGVKAMAGSLASAAMDAVKGAVNGMKDFLGIHSPSKLTEKLIGHNMMAGVKVAFKGDTSELEKSAVDAMKDVTSAMSDVDYVAKLKTIQIPDITGMTGIRAGIHKTKEARPEGQHTGTDSDDIKTAVKEGVREGMKDMKVEMDGRETGKVIAPYVNEFMPQPAW